jgi:hypothetical protein
VIARQEGLQTETLAEGIGLPFLAGMANGVRFFARTLNRQKAAI